MASIIYHAGALGDFVTTLPAMTIWSAGHPGEPLVLLGRPEHGALAAHLFDDVWDAGGAELSSLFAREGAPGSGVVRRFSAVSSALLFTAESSPLTATLLRLGVREILRQDPLPPSTIHVVDYHLRLFEGRVRAGDRIPRIPNSAGGAERRGIALHHGSGSPGKNWPRARYEELSAIFHARGERVAWVTGPAEKDSRAPQAAESWNRLPLPELARRIACRRLFVGNDSGVTHLAAATGCPTVALFGASDHLVWSPRGPRVRVLRSGSGRMEDLTVEDVLRTALDCIGESR